MGPGHILGWHTISEMRSKVFLLPNMLAASAADCTPDGQFTVIKGRVGRSSRACSWWLMLDPAPIRARLKSKWGYAVERDSLFRQFKKKAEALGCRVERLDDQASVRRFLEDFLPRLQIQRLASSDIRWLAETESKILGGRVRLARSVTEIVDADAGLIFPQLAVAETGSVLQIAESVLERLTTILPPVLIAIVPLSRLIGTLDQAWTYLASMPVFPGYAGFISGPSRTADIERSLTFGVHGPKEVIVLVVDEL